MLKDLIGKSRPPDADNAVYLSDITIINLCDLISPEGPYFNDVDRAIASAQATLEADLIAFLSRWYSARTGFSGQIGSNNYTQMKATNEPLILPTNAIEGASITISKFGRLVSQAGTYTVTITKEGASEPLHSVGVTLTDRSTTQYVLTPGWKIPCDGSRYLVTMNLPSGVQFGNNNVHCGCGSGLSGLLPYMPLSGSANGFLLTLQTSCGYELLIDRLIQDSRYSRVLAWMMAYKTTEILVGPSLTGDVSRDNVLSGEDRQAAASVCQGEYLNRLNWLKNEDLNLDLNGTCLQAKSNFGMSRGGIYTGY